MSEGWDRTVDVVVVGGGGAGLAAAVQAARHGAQTLLVEKAPALGGSTRLSIGSMTAAGTRIQAEKGITDSTDAFFEDMAKFCGPLAGRDNPELKAVLAREAANSLHWLQSLGVPFLGPFPEPPHRVPRMHNAFPNSSAYIHALRRAARRSGVTVLTDTGASELIRSTAGAVEGVVLHSGDRRQRVRARQGVVLTTGDYTSSPALKAEYMGPEVAHVPPANPHNTGDGHRLGVAVGGVVANMDISFSPSLRFVSPARPSLVERMPPMLGLGRGLAWVLRHVPPGWLRLFVTQVLTSHMSPTKDMFVKGALMINRQGLRFTDETRDPARGLAEQKDLMAYMILDQKLATRFSRLPDYISTAPGIAYAFFQDYRRARPDLVHESSDLGGLARQLGVPAENLQATVDQYNERARAGSTDAFGRRCQTPLDSPPYHAMGPLTCMFISTEGGLRVNTRCQVLSREGGVIPGLYAAGSCAGGMVLAGHGLHIGWAITSGRIAGEAVTRG